jgi:hypothetical protein
MKWGMLVGPESRKAVRAQEWTGSVGSDRLPLKLELKRRPNFLEDGVKELRMEAYRRSLVVGPRG